MDRGRHILNRLILPSTYCNNSFQHQRRRGSRRVWSGHFKTAGPCFSSRWCIKVSCAGKICKRYIALDKVFYNLLSCYFSPDGIPEQFDGNLNIGSDISDWIRREVTADEIEVNLENFIMWNWKGLMKYLRGCEFFYGFVLGIHCFDFL